MKSSLNCKKVLNLKLTSLYIFISNSILLLKKNFLRVCIRRNLVITIFRQLCGLVDVVIFFSTRMYKEKSSYRYFPATLWVGFLQLCGLVDVVNLDFLTP